MDYEGRFIMQKTVNWSLLNDGMTSIIHKNNPHFNRKKFQFEFENGEVLGLKLYEHLKV